MNSFIVFGMLAWAVWLASMGKSNLDYVIEDARRQLPLESCKWIAIGSPSVATLGLSYEPSQAWTNRKAAILAFRTKETSVTSSLQLRLVGIASNRAFITVDSGDGKKITNAGVYRFQLDKPHVADVHTISIKVANPQSPQGQDRRWLGVAISELRVCAAD